MIQENANTVIITGASRGIGAAAARLAAVHGFSVAVNHATGALEAETIARGIREQGGKAAAIQADIACEADILRLFSEAERELGPICGLVNNAGVTGGFARVDAVTAQALERLFAVNVTGAILCAREAVKRMSTRHGGKGGAIVNLSSLAARTGSAGEWVHYAASKGAIDTFTSGRRGYPGKCRRSGAGRNWYSCCKWRTGAARAVEGYHSDGAPRKAGRDCGSCGVVAFAGFLVCHRINTGGRRRKVRRPQPYP